MSARNRTLPTRCALAALALSIAIALWPAAAFAGGPGVTVIGRELDAPFTLSGDQISAGADVPATSFTVRERPGTLGRKVTIAGMSVRSVLLRAGIDPSSIRRVAISRGDGSDLVLSSADLAQPGPFKEGPPLIADVGGGTRVFRPVRNARDTNARDDFDSSGAGPLLIRVDDATSLAVQASATPTVVRTGRDVTFTASVRFSGGGLTYHWEFGDGNSAEGKTVTHSFETAFDYQVQVTVTGSCSAFCQGLDSVSVRVGTPRKGPDAPGATNPGSGSGNPLAPGTGTGTGAGGTGTGGGGPGGGATDEASVQQVVRELAAQRAADRAKERARRLAAQRKRQAAKQAARKAAAADRARRQKALTPAKPGVVTITGILLAGQGTPLKGGLPPLPAASSGKPEGAQAARGTSLPDTPAIPASVAFAVLVVGLGALRERRLVRLRVA